MKYIVLMTINSNVDAGHPSGTGTCSTGNGLPWIFAESKLCNSREEANALAAEVDKKWYDEFVTNRQPSRGWQFISGYQDLSVEKLDKNGDIIDSEWLYSIDVLELEE